MKKIISALICVCMLMTMAAGISTASADTSAKDTDINNGVLLYYWYNDYAGSKYMAFNNTCFETLSEVSDEYIMIPIIAVNYYVDKNGDLQEIISMDDINSLTLDDIQWTSEYALENTKQEYIDRYNNLSWRKYTLNEYVDETVELAQKIVAVNPDVRLWFSVPVTPMHALSDLQGPIWNEYVIDAFKEQVGSEIWDNNIQGIYFANEDAYPGFTKFDYDDPENDFDNQVVKAMRDVSDKIHSYGKSMVWIPYCIYSDEFGWEMYRRIGAITNMTDIFDTVTIQPKIYFGQNTADDIGFLKESLDAQAFIDPDTGDVIGGEKTSSTNVGIEIELDSKMLDDQVYYDRFYEMLDYFKDYIGEIPLTVYAGAPQELMAIYEYVDEALTLNDPEPPVTSSASSVSDVSSDTSDTSDTSSAGGTSNTDTPTSSASSVPNPQTGAAGTSVIAAAVLLSVSAVAVVATKKRG